MSNLMGTALRGRAGVIVAAAVMCMALVATDAAAQGSGQTAEFTRGEFRSLMEKYPPALGRVLVLDPTLLTNEDYLKSYPALQQYLAKHPEIPRDPRYFLIDYLDARLQPTDPAWQQRQQAINAWRSMFDGVLFFSGFTLFVLSLGWLIKYVVDHRRWLRLSKTQSEVHAKLMERFTSSEDLRAYMESPAGQSFLRASPLSTEPVAASAGAVIAPLNRILWSVQVGVVAVAVGIGFLFVRRGLDPEVAQMVGTWGTLAIALGVGFAASAAAAYVLSSRLGLLDNRTGVRQG